jgi:hypothetical protein
LEKAGSLKSLYDSSTVYAGLLLKTGKHKYYRISTDLLAATLRATVILLLSAACLLFLSLGAAFWLSELTGSLKLSFFIMGGIYLLLIACVFLAAQSRLGTKLKDRILKQVAEYPGDYAQLREKETALEKELAAGEIKLRSDYNAVKEEFSGMTGSAGEGADSVQDAAKVKSSLPGKLIGQAAEFLIGNFLLKGAGPVKRLVVPAIANAIIRSRFSGDKNKQGWFSKIKSRFSKNP